MLRSTMRRLVRVVEVEETARLLAAALALALATLWIVELAYQAPAWVTWVDAAATIVALVAAPTIGGEDMLGVALSVAITLLMLAIFAFGALMGASPWTTWPHLLLGGGFLLLVVAGPAIVGRSRPRDAASTA